MTQQELSKAVKKTVHLRKRKRKELGVLSFQKNLNRKLYNDFFTHIEHSPKRMEKGEEVAVFCGFTLFGIAKVIDAKVFKINQLPAVTCILDRGETRAEYMMRLKNKYLDDGHNFIDDDFTIYTLEYIERELVSEPWIFSL